MPTPDTSLGPVLATLDALDATQRSIADVGRSLNDAARCVGQIEATLQHRLEEAARPLRAVYAWLEAQRDEADRSDRGFWQEQIHNLGQAMAILRLPITSEE